MKTLLALLLIIPSLSWGNDKIIFCYSLNEDNKINQINYYEINKKKKTIKNIKDFYNPNNGYAEFNLPETEDWDQIYPNYEILNIRFEKNHIMFQQKFKVDDETAIDFIEIDEISGKMILYSFIYIDEDKEKIYSHKDNEIKYLNNYSEIKANASHIVYQCEKNKDLLN